MGPVIFSLLCTHPYVYVVDHYTELGRDRKGNGRRDDVNREEGEDTIIPYHPHQLGGRERV